jgi:hypothetical protein
MKRLTHILLILCLSQFFRLNAQTLVNALESNKPNYCDSIVKEDLIGQKVKIWHKGGCIGCTDFKPTSGMIGEIVDIYSPYSDQTIYVINFNDTLVEFDCKYLTDPSLPDIDMAWAIADSIENKRMEEYANGCPFKTRDINGNWNRAGLFNIDTISESFACGLLNSGIDTIMLVKYIYDNGSSPFESAYVLWQENGEMYLKTYYNNSDHLPEGQEVEEFDWSKISNFYFANRLDTVVSYPETKYYQSHDMGFVVMFYSPGYDFFCDRLPNYIFIKSKRHIKSKFWKLVFEDLSDKIIYNYR